MRKVVAAVAMSLIVAACAGYPPSLIPGSSFSTPTPTIAPSDSPVALADRVLEAIQSGSWAGTFRLSGTITLRHGTSRPQVQRVHGSFEILGHDSSSFVQVTSGATTRSTELVIVGSQAWQRRNGGAAYPVRRSECLDFPDMLVHATAMEEDGPAGSLSGQPLTRLLVTDFAPVDCAQGYVLSVRVTPSTLLMGLSIGRTRTIEVNGQATVEVTALEARWWGPTATIRAPAGAWQRVDDPMDMLVIDLPSTWRIGAQNGVEVFSDVQTGATIRILTTPAGDRTLGVVVAQERAALKEVQRFSLASSTKRDVGGFAAQVMAYHFIANGHRRFGIRAVTVHDGLVTELTWTRLAGHEGADEELFRAILGTITFDG